MAAGILFQNELSPSLTDVYKKAMLVNEINTPLIQGKNIPSSGASSVQYRNLLSSIQSLIPDAYQFPRGSS